MDCLLFYDYSPDYLARRGAFRAEHLALAWDAQSKGHLVLAGALANPADGAVCHFRGDSPTVARRRAPSATPTIPSAASAATVPSTRRKRTTAGWAPSAVHTRSMEGSSTTSMPTP
jgi:uncharacterized protein YciI